MVKLMPGSVRAIAEMVVRVQVEDDEPAKGPLGSSEDVAHQPIERVVLGQRTLDHVLRRLFPPHAQPPGMFGF